MFLTRLAVQTAVYLETGARIDLGRWLRRQHAQCLDRPLWIGVRHRLPVRLLATRVPAPVAAGTRSARPACAGPTGPS